MAVGRKDSICVYGKRKRDEAAFLGGGVARVTLWKGVSHAVVAH